MTTPGFATSRGSIALAACALALLAGRITSQKESKPSQKEISRELQQLAKDDQKDQNDPRWDEANDREFSLRQKERRDRVVEILQAGMLADMHDWSHATLLLQHGQSADDFLLAHVLSIPPAGAGEPLGKFLCAATLDRFLHTIGRAQIFTTQSGSPDPSLHAPIEPFDDSMSQGLRDLFELKPLPGKEEKGKEKKGKKAKGPSAKELPKLLQQAQSEPAGKDSAAEWLQRAREIVLAGELKSDKDFELAARVLLLSPDSEDLLSAHVLSTCAAFKAKNAAAHKLCAESLDRFLLSIGRQQRFGTVLEQEQPKEPHSPLPSFILAEYGLADAKK